MTHVAPPQRKARGRNIHKTWDSETLAAFRAAQTPERALADAQALASLFNKLAAAGAPLVQEALAWAQANTIEFIVDRATTAGGYYNVGSGVVAVSSAVLRSVSDAANVLVHELRHAWQDAHGLVPTVTAGFAAHGVTLGLYEADAYAHGKLAADQVLLACAKQRRQNAKEQDLSQESINAEANMIARAEKRLADPRQALAAYFENWYAYGPARAYGGNVQRLLANKVGVPKMMAPNYRCEYVPARYPVVEETDYATHPDAARRFGKGFFGTGGNYFDKLSRDDVRRVFVASSPVYSLFGSSKKQSALTQDIRKRELQLKRQNGGRLRLSLV